MPVSHETVMFDVHDAFVAPLLSDQEGELPVYGDPVDLFGVSEVGLDPNFVTAELKGDARVIAKKGRIDRVNLSTTWGKLSLDAMAVIYGTSTSDVASATSTLFEGAASTSGSPTITVASGAVVGLIGRAITGTGIPAGTVVIGANGTTEITMSADATATSADVDVTVAARPARAISRLASPAPLPYFKFGFQIQDLDDDLADLQVINYKCQVGGGTPLGSSTDNFGQPSADMEAIALEGSLWAPDNSAMETGVIMDVLLSDTLSALHSG